MPVVNKNFSPEQFAKQRVRIREKNLPNLERQHAELLEPNYKPRQGGWEETGK